MKQKMRHILSVMMIMTMIVSVGFFGQSAYADEPVEWTVEDFTFSEDGATVTGLSEAGVGKLELNPDVVIPGMNGETAVTAIGERAFSISSTEGLPITTVTFPESLESIGQFAFQACVELTAIVIPESVKTIGNAAFSGTNKVGTLVLPAELENLGGGAFQKTVTDESTPAIDKIVVPSGLAEIPANAFGGLLASEIVIPEGVTKIGSRAFMNSKIVKLNLPSTVTAIDSYAFSQQHEAVRYSLKSISLPEGLESIAGNAFAYSGIEAATLPTTVTNLNKTSFANGEKRVKLISSVEDQINAAGDYTKVVVSGSGHDVVGTEWNTDDFTFDGQTVTGLSTSGVAKRPFHSELIVPATNPDGEAVTAIGAADPNAGGLFASADEKFDKVVLPDTVTVIGANAFRDAGLKEINFPAGLTTIGNFAFMTNSLEEVILPDTVTTLGSGVFATIFTLEKIHIPENNEFTSIPASTFGCSGAGAYMTGLTEITIPSNITAIGDRAFAGNALTSVEIPGSVKTIGKYAFAQTPAPKSLTKVVLNEGVESIGADAFDECAAKSIVLPTTIKTVHKKAFLHSYERDKVKLLTTLAIDALPSGVSRDSDYHELVNTSDAVEELQDEVEAVSKKVEAMVTLSAAIFDAQTKDVSSFKTKTVTAFKTAISNAVATLKNNASTIEDLENAKADIEKAEAGLVKKANNTMKVTTTAKTVKLKKVKKAKQVVVPIKVKNAKGTVTYSKASGSSKLTVAAKTGKVTVKKGTKKGTYKIKVKVKAAGNGDFKALTKTVTVTVKVKK